jgi:hypothetical protein
MMKRGFRGMSTNMKTLLFGGTVILAGVAHSASAEIIYGGGVGA